MEFFAKAGETFLARLPAFLLLEGESHEYHIEALQKGKVPPDMPLLSEAESFRASQFIQSIISGQVGVPRNNRHGTLTPVAIGKGARVKINANIGTSPASCDFENEMQKLKAAIYAGADAVMDLSIAGNTSDFRKRIIENSNPPGNGFEI